MARQGFVPSAGGEQQSVASIQAARGLAHRAVLTLQYPILLLPVSAFEVAAFRGLGSFVGLGLRLGLRLSGGGL
jgi:hypothetical protein